MPGMRKIAVIFWGCLVLLPLSAQPVRAEGGVVHNKSKFVLEIQYNAVNRVSYGDRENIKFRVMPNDSYVREYRSGNNCKADPMYLIDEFIVYIPNWSKSQQKKICSRQVAGYDQSFEVTVANDDAGNPNCEIKIYQTCKSP